MVVRRIRGALLVGVSLLGVCCIWCGESLANIPSIRPVRSGRAPFIQVEEFVPGTAKVSAEFYAFMEDPPVELPTTSTLQYVDALDYAPGSADPYAAGTTVALGETTSSVSELHAHLVLDPNTVYHFRVIAENTSGTFETPDQTVETLPPSRGGLPDARVDEQVSPPDKNNVDALGNGQYRSMQASPSSVVPAFAYFSFEPFPLAIGTGYFNVEYLSVRAPSPAGWSTQSLQGPISSARGVSDGVVGFTEDLAKTVVQLSGPPAGPSVGPPGHINAYVRDNATGSYQLLAPDTEQGLLFVDASRDDSRILFESTQQLLPTAIAGKLNLYEWDETKSEDERLSLAGVLPDDECIALSEPKGCAPPDGSGAGAGTEQPSSARDYPQNTISEDGSMVFFTAHPSNHIYERDLSGGPVTVPVSLAAATFLAATPSGEYVFYSEGTELYRFDTANETRQVLTSGAEDVLGSLGVSDDGSYAYFVAQGVLAANENASKEVATKGAPNLYVWHEDPGTHVVTISFITGGAASSAWQGTDEGEEGKTSRLTPDGTKLLFMSQSQLTGYDNGQVGSSLCSEGNTQIPCQELFLYDAGRPPSTDNPECVSCNPTASQASANAGLNRGETEEALKGPVWSPHVSRNLSANGDRVFFETSESLVPSDINGVGDVYEWEREGVGSCPAGTNHCLYLISTGTAHARSFFGDASASGDDVFFFTRQSLVGQDDDLNDDVYDARVGGGIAAQNPTVDHCEGEVCKPGKSPAPTSESPGSITLTGMSNLAPPTPVVAVPPPKKVKCAKGRKLSHGKCVKIKRKKRTETKKKSAKRHRGGR